MASNENGITCPLARNYAQACYWHSWFQQMF